MIDFSDIATYYDRMTGYSNRLVNDFGLIKNLVKKFNFETVLDAGCGSGIHSVILSKIGVDVIGLDASKEMLDLARANALKEGIELELIQEYYESMPNLWTDKFDGLLCMANSLVGVETGERLSLAFKSFNRVLKPGGKAIIQLMNFVKFRRGGQRIIKVSNDGNLTFVRFFDFEENETRLNLIIIEHEMGDVKHTFISNKILPVNEEVVTVASKLARFSNIELYSDLSLTDKFSSDSGNMVVVLTK